MACTIANVIQVFALVVLARIILEYIPVSFEHPVAKVRRVFRAITDPLLTPLRAIIPPVRLGTGMALDLSPLILLIGLQILAAAIC